MISGGGGPYQHPQSSLRERFVTFSLYTEEEGTEHASTLERGTKTVLRIHFSPQTPKTKAALSGLSVAGTSKSLFL